MTASNEKPCLVSTAQGFSVLYNQRYLFSRYNPQKAFLNVLEKTVILPESLILCVSPVLPFSLKSIEQKLTNEGIKDCFILGLEYDENLFNFFLNQKMDFSSNCGIFFAKKTSDLAYALENTFHLNRYEGSKPPSLSHFRRIVVLESSSDSQTHKSFYHSCIAIAQSSVTQFWKNRMTLMQLGKLFSKNTLTNILKYENSTPIQAKSISKSILVVGAGSSLDDLLPFIRENRNSFYILAIAASLRPLLDNGIRPDAIVSVEAQYATEKAFIGAKNLGIHLFADIVSRPSILNILNGPVSFFMSEYATSPLLERIKKSFTGIPVFPPLGSVGLSCTELALYLRLNENVPVFICGLDFAFSIGKTHCKESPHIKQAHLITHRLSPIGNVGSSFRFGSMSFIGKKGISVVSDRSLKSYGDLFSARFKSCKNVFDIGQFGMPNDLVSITLDQLSIFITTAYANNSRNEIILSNDKKTMCRAFCENEKQRLENIKAILTGHTVTSTNELLAYIEECNYLFLHFPDGHKGARSSQDFLNRIRFEVDYFLKLL